MENNLVATSTHSKFGLLLGLLAENVRRYAHGLPLMNVVDKERGY